MLKIVIIILNFLVLFYQSNYAFAASDQIKALPSCSQTGDIKCPSGYSVQCPSQYKPYCVFLGTKQIPSCLLSSTDNTVFKYDLNKISCKKK